MPISTTGTEEIPGSSRRSKRSSGSSVSQHPTWVILNEAGGQRDNYAGDRTTSSTCSTSDGDLISVSFDLVEPPGTTVLVVDRHGGPAGPLPQVVAADGDAVLFRMTPTAKNRSPFLVDYFVYKSSSSGGSRRPSLSLLPTFYSGRRSFDGRPEAHIFFTEAIGLLSCTEESFVVAELEKTASASEFKVNVQMSGSDGWTVFEGVPLRRASDRDGMVWWTTDAVVPYRRRFLIWVDYYRGMIVADMSSCSGNKKPSSPPELRFVPLPVDMTDECPDDCEWGRGCPRVSRSVCTTRSGIKFVSVDHQEISSFGVGKMKRWRHTFRITTWSLRDDDYTWRREARLYEEEFWSLDVKNQLPHVRPRFPVVNMENPDAVCFLLDDSRFSCGSTDTTWMIEVDMKKKVLLAATICSDETSLPCQDTIKAARRMSLQSSLVSSALPRYLYAGEASKKVRRQ